MADRGTGRFWEAPNYVNRRLRLLPGTGRLRLSRGSSRILPYGTGAGIPDLSLRHTIHTKYIRQNATESLRCFY